MFRSARQNRENVVTEIVDATGELPVAVQPLRELLMDPQVYPRICTGIGACEQVDARDGHPVWQIRIGTPGVGLRTLTVTLRPGRGGNFEMLCLDEGSFAIVRLSGTENRTRITVTYFGLSRVHPALVELSNSAVVDWTESALPSRRTGVGCADFGGGR
jgi:hypothetical protein